MLDRAVPVRFGERELVGVAVTHEAEVLGQQHELRAFAGGFRDQAARLGEIARDVRRAHHLQRGDLEGRGGTGVVGHRWIGCVINGVRPGTVRGPTRGSMARRIGRTVIHLTLIAPHPLDVRVRPEPVIV